MTFAEWQQKFSTAANCHTFLANLRWPEGFVCPNCGGREAWPVHRSHRQRSELYECKQCGRQTSVTAGTMFHRSKVPLPVWFLAIYRLVVDGRDISAGTLARDLGVGLETASLLRRKIQQAMTEHNGSDTLVGTWIARGMPDVLATPGLPRQGQYRDQWTSENILSALQLAHRQSGYLTRTRWSREQRTPAAGTIVRIFGSWGAAWLAAGVEDRWGASAADVLAVLREVGEYVPQQEWCRRRGQAPCASTIRRVFGSYPAAWRAAGIEPVRRTKSRSRSLQEQHDWHERILAAMQAAGRYYTVAEWTRAGMRPSAGTVYHYFDSWAAAWRAAGITPKDAPRRS